MVTSLLVACLLSTAKPTAAFQPKNRPYDAIHYRINFRLKDDSTFDNKLTMTVKPKKALAEIELDARGLEISSAKIGGEPATYKIQYEPTLRTGTVTLKAAKPMAANVEATIEIAYSGKVSATAHEGLFTVDSDDADAPPYYFTQFEPTYAQAFFPCNDTPEDKATSEIFAVVDGRYTVLSNGRKDKDETFTEAGKNLRRVSWKQEQPHSPYLIAVEVPIPTNPPAAQPNDAAPAHSPSLLLGTRDRTQEFSSSRQDVDVRLPPVLRDGSRLNNTNPARSAKP